MKERVILWLLLLSCWLNGWMPAVYAQPPRYQASSSSKHLYQISGRDPLSGEKRIGFIDRTGRTVIGYDRLPRTTVLAGGFHEGRAVFYVTRMIRYESKEYERYVAGYIDQTGEVIVAPIFDVAHDFSEGLAYVEVDAEGFKGFIDRKGKRVIQIVGSQAKDFHEGLAAVESEGKQWGYIDSSGRAVTKPQFGFADDFSEGLAGVVSNGKYGFINRQLNAPTVCTAISSAS